MFLDELDSGRLRLRRHVDRRPAHDRCRPTRKSDVDKYLHGTWVVTRAGRAAPPAGAVIRPARLKYR
ncbi:hypothetical protein EVAR_51799_1 [Eumeta japonica]|uniref:Uncharacterized protein n=1 Tax=Eumeta variegata TaxID=151549 RepID=A0A4C2A2T0_EUMVA|nr:hypothetical protein EVAR_51799_1 [Eumeta japonica]